jgi:hypothetical protein
MSFIIKMIDFLWRKMTGAPFAGGGAFDLEDEKDE